ncbi:MAG TPA: DUF2478 domain-containing protein [Polyangiales bacterium]
MSLTEAPAAPRLAAIVYDEEVAIDLLLHVFAQDLSARRVRVGGVLNELGPEPGCGPDQPLHLRDLRSGESIRLCHRLETDTGEARCRLEPRSLSLAGASIRSACERGAQVVFLPRFGKQELQGSGFRDVFEQVGALSCAVLTAVPRLLVEPWRTFTRGACTLLSPRLRELHAWWAATEPQLQHTDAAWDVENVRWNVQDQTRPALRAPNFARDTSKNGPGRDWYGACGAPARQHDEPAIS